MNTKIIGVSGSNGSGKDTIMHLLKQKFGFLSVSATELLAAELILHDKPTDREHKAALSAEWRREHGMGVIVQKAYEAWQREAHEYPGGVVVGSLRHPGEADKVHELGGTVIWIDADPRIRYERIQANMREGRALEDLITFEEFLAQEEREMHPTGDAATLDMASVKERADIFMDNGGDSIETFETAAVHQLGLDRHQ